MKTIKAKIQLFMGIFLAQYNVYAYQAEVLNSEDSSMDQKNNIGFALDTNDKKQSLFEASCDRLNELKEQVDLSIEDIDEALLLEEMVGVACDSPIEYEMASIAHKIKEL